VPALIGGSADLTGSVNTLTKSTAPLTAQDFAGRYIHYGVREHGMAAVMNGMALHGGYRPYAGTFLVFANYLHPALRLSCLMGLPVTYVLTHDSIGLGEDGPTHQPVEQLGRAVQALGEAQLGKLEQELRLELARRPDEESLRARPEPVRFERRHRHVDRGESRRRGRGHRDRWQHPVPGVRRRTRGPQAHRGAREPERHHSDLDLAGHGWPDDPHGR
jgi:hypothetical protein